MGHRRNESPCGRLSRPLRHNGLGRRV
jgi:hypothetical protein